MMWGLRPGPLLFEKNPDFVWGLIASLYLANVLLLILNIGFIPAFVRALRVRTRSFMALIVVFCITGAYARATSSGTSGRCWTSACWGT